MNIFFIPFMSITSIICFSQRTQKQLNDSLTNSMEISTFLHGVDISKASPNEQGLINYMDTLSDENTLQLFKSVSNSEIILKEGNESEILVEEIKIGCGNNFFSESDDQHALIVMGIWCGDSYFWAPISMGTQITEEAFRNNELFTGECIDQDSVGRLMAKYTFENGKMNSLTHFHTDGKVFKIYTFDKGIPNGISSEYESNGILKFRRSYELGILNGPFYEMYYTDDPDCRIRIDEGVYTNNEKLLNKSICN